MPVGPQRFITARRSAAMRFENVSAVDTGAGAASTRCATFSMRASALRTDPPGSRIPEPRIWPSACNARVPAPASARAGSSSVRSGLGRGSGSDGCSTVLPTASREETPSRMPAHARVTLVRQTFIGLLSGIWAQELAFSAMPSVLHRQPSASSHTTRSRAIRARHERRNVSRPMAPGHFTRSTSRHSAVGDSRHRHVHRRPLSCSSRPARRPGQRPSAAHSSNQRVGTGCQATHPSTFATDPRPATRQSARTWGGSILRSPLIGSRLWSSAFMVAGWFRWPRPRGLVARGSGSPQVCKHLADFLFAPFSARGQSAGSLLR